MIRLDVSTLLFFYILFSVIIILVIWVLFVYKRTGAPGSKEVDYAWRCSVCSHSYIDSRSDEMSVCPLCGSYNKKEEMKR